MSQCSELRLRPSKAPLPSLCNPEMMCISVSSRRVRSSCPLVGNIIGNIFNRENAMRRGKNRERADNIQGLDDLDRSVLLGSHYQAVVKLPCHLEHLKDELSSTGLQS